MNDNTEVTNPENTAPVIQAKRGRGRPKLAETAYDRAVAILKALPADAENKARVDAVVASGIKKSSAAVYVSKAKREGLI
jgi:hypothetical protein